MVSMADQLVKLVVSIPGQKVELFTKRKVAASLLVKLINPKSMRETPNRKSYFGRLLAAALQASLHRITVPATWYLMLLIIAF